MNWIDAGGRPKGYRLREPLLLEDGSQPATLFVQCYFKPSAIAGVADKLSFGLFYRNVRVLAIDLNGPSGHRNEVGVGRTHFGEIISHPHLHSIGDDALDGYAQPIPDIAPQEQWVLFRGLANIGGAPDLSLPVLQGNLLL